MSINKLKNEVLRYKHYLISIVLCFIGGGCMYASFLVNKEYANLLLSIGTTTFTSGIFTTFYSFIVKKDFNESLKIDLKEILNEDNINKVEGIQEVYTKFPMDIFLKKLKNANNEIIIYQTIFPEAFQFIDELESLLTKNVRIKILLLDPISQYAIKRAKEQNQYENFIIDGYNTGISIIRKSLKELIDNNTISDEQKKLICLKKYNTRYAFSMYKIDDSIIFGVFWNQHSMTNGPQIMFKSDSIFAKSLIKHFNLIWSDKNITKDENI